MEVGGPSERFTDAIGFALGELRTPGSADEAEVLAEVFAAMDVQAAPVRLGRYQIDQALGQGGAGAVFQATDTRLQRQVAVKLVRARPVAAEDATRAQARLIREARAAARVAHPNVVQIFDVGTYAPADVEALGVDVASEGVYVVMELAEGRDLSHWLRTPRSQSEVLAVMREAGRGLAATHRAGLLHRDFKPANVLVGSSGDGSSGNVKVADFGLARAHTLGAASHSVSSGPSTLVDTADESQSVRTKVGVAVGTLPYMSPQQQEGQASEAADQYSFCVTLFEALVGERPFRGSAVDSYAAKRAGQVPPTPSVPAWLRAVIVRGLAPDPSERFPSMDALLRAMQPPARRRGRWLAAGGVLLLVAGFASRPSDACDDHRASTDAMEDAVGARAPVLRAHVGQTADAWAEYCAAARGAELDPHNVARRQCLEDGTAQRRRLLELWRSERLSTAEAERALNQLPVLSSCAESERHHLPAGIAAQASSVRAHLSGAHALLEAGHVDHATVEAGEALSEAEALGYPPVLAEAHHLLGRAEIARGRVDVAITLYEKAFWGASEVDHVRTMGHAAESLAHAHGRERRDFAAAREWERHAQAAFDRRDAPPEVYAAFVNIKATNRMAVGEVAQAAALFDEAIALLEASDKDTQSDLAVALNNLGEARSRLGEFEAADAALARAVAIRQELSPQTPRYATVLAHLAQNLARQGKTEQAESRFREALDVLDVAAPKGHPNRPVILSMMGAALGQAGKLDAASEAFTSAVAYYDAVGQRGRVWANLHNNLSLAAIKREQWEDARRHLELALEGFPEEHAARTDVFLRLARVALKTGHADAARSYLGRAQDAAEHGTPEDYEARLEDLWAEARAPEGE